MKVGHHLLAALTCCFFAAGNAQAQAVDDLRVQRLEDTIRNLELRIGALEAQLAEKTEPTKPTSGAANWRKLKVGMSEVEVVKLIGTPTKVNDRQAHFNWLYGSPASGFVRFDASTKTVMAWSPPGPSN